MLALGLNMPALLRGAGSSTSIPSFSRDFVTVKTLNHGIGPDITFTRTGTATYFNSSGVLTTATANEPRFDHDPSTLASKGLLIEEGRTNSIRNSQAGGSTNGVIGSGGVMPTNWAFGSATGITREVIGSGTISGMSYIDIKFSGTNNSGSTIFPQITFESPTQILASSGQTWALSVYVSLISGSLTGIDLRTNIQENQADGTYLANSNSSFTPTSSLLRYTHTRTLSNASTARVAGSVIPFISNGVAIDATIRIAAPQLEQGAFATSYIPTTSAAVARGADNAVITTISSFFNASEGTLFAEASTFAQDSSRVVFEFGDGTTSNRIYILRNGATSAANFITTVSGSAQASLSQSSVFIVNTTCKTISAYKLDDFAATANGSTVTTDTSGSIPTVNKMAIGSTNTLAAIWCGHIRKVAYYPKRLTNDRLKSLTA